MVRQLQFQSILIAIVGAATWGDRALAAAPNAPLSLGYPNAGRLVGGRRFRDTPFMAVDEAHANSRVRWALPALLSVLDRASRIVARKFPGSVLEIGELSRHDGGPITSHLSHQNGRDADVGFYRTDLDGQSIRAPRFVRFDGSGESHDDPTVRFDEKRNWAFVRAILEDPRYEVRQIFIYAPLRARLLAYATKVGAPRDLRTRAARAMMQPVNALPHDDHFHIRISCPADQVDLGCTDLPLWRSPGSPDEFGPDLLAEVPRLREREPPDVFSPYDWGRISKLWSVQQGVCHKAEMTCTAIDEGPLCEDMGDFGLPVAVFPAEETALPLPEAALEPSAAGEDPVRISLSVAPEATALDLVSLSSTIESKDGANGVLCAASDVAPPGPSIRGMSLSYSAIDDEPNSCERPVTALASPDPASSADRSVLQ